MTETELLRILKEEETQASSFHNSELAADQAGALDRYHARPYGDEVAGRSQVVTHDLEDAINWIMPDLMRMFMGADQIVSLEGTNAEDEESGRTDEAADYLDFIFRNDNDGDEVIHDFAFDGLLQRMGVVSVAWKDPEPKAPKELQGVSPEQLVKFTQDPEYEILEQEQDPQTGMFSLLVQQTPKMGRCKVEPVPPEEFAISKQARCVDSAQYHRRKREKYYSELMLMFPDMRDKMDPEGTITRQEEELSTDPRFIARHSDDALSTMNTSDAGPRKKGILLEEYIRADFDGDGVAELRCIKRVGDVICENVVVDKSQFVVWTPIRVAHRVAGRSMDDLLKDIMKIRTVIMRRALDGMAQSLTPRKAANTKLLGEEGIADLTDNDIGGVVRVDGDVREAIMDLTTPDTSGSALAVMEYMDQRSEEASGVNRQSQGMDPQAMNKTATGIDLLQAAGKVRTELIARWLAKGLERVFKRMLELVIAHQDGPRQVKIKGKFIEIDPRNWSDEMGVRVHVAMAAASRSSQVANLMMIAQKQEQILQLAGPANPMVPLPKYRHTLAKAVEAMGFKDSSQFFAEIPDEWQPPQEGEKQDPKMVEVQAKIAADQAKMQADQQMKAQEFEHKKQMAELDAQTQTQIAAQKIANEREIAILRMQAESEQAAQRTAAEMHLARWKAEQEMMLARENNVMAAANRTHEIKTKAVSNGVRMGGKIG